MSPMKTISLGELLTEEQGREVVRIMSESKDDAEMTARLKKYLAQFKDQLEAKGVVPEYLAYAIPYFVNHPLERPAPGRAEPS